MAKVLIIDDDIDTLNSLKGLLTINDYQVEAISKWHEVFDKIGEFRPDLIILDVFLDGIDGRNICKQIKTEPATRTIPVIMYSGNEAVGDHILSYGADDFLVKPMQVPELLEKIRMRIKTPAI